LNFLQLKTERKYANKEFDTPNVIFSVYSQDLSKIGLKQLKISHRSIRDGDIMYHITTCARKNQDELISLLELDEKQEEEN